MKTQVYFGIAIRIILMGIIATLLTYIPDHLRDFFGDIINTSRYKNGAIDRDWVWGIRHYIYFTVVTLLWFLSLIVVILDISKLLAKNYPNSF